MTMNPAASVRAFVGNIMDTEKFPISFFAEHVICLNALDNLGKYSMNMDDVDFVWLSCEKICEWHVFGGWDSPCGIGDRRVPWAVHCDPAA